MIEETSYRGKCRLLALVLTASSISNGQLKTAWAREPDAFRGVQFGAANAGAGRPTHGYFYQRHRLSRSGLEDRLFIPYS